MDVLHTDEMNLSQTCLLLWRGFLGAFFPTSCVSCSTAGQTLCSRCERELYATLTKHFVGGMPVWSFWRYEGAVRRMLLSYKQKNRMDVLPILSAGCAELVAASLRYWRFQVPQHLQYCVIVIPSSRRAFRMRGFHPTREILKRVQTIPNPAFGALKFTKEPKNAHKQLSLANRQRSRRGSFVASKKLRNKHCVLVDDILTSGSTLLEAKRAIEAVGGIVIAGLVLAHAQKQES